MIALAAGVLSVVLLEVEQRLRVLHPASFLFVLLLALTFAPGVAAAAITINRLLRGCWRAIHIRWTIAAVLPGLIWAGAVGYALHQFNRRDIPRNWAMRMIELAGASVMEARAVYLTPHRIETQRLVMFYGPGVFNPQRDANEMDRHVARMEELTGLRLRAKIFYVRGPMFAGRHVSFRGLAFGTAQSPANSIDRHELAHAIIGQHEQPDSYPPTLLSEGWAESQSNTSQELAREALRQRKLIADWSASWPRMSEPERQSFRESLVDPEGFARLLTLVGTRAGADAFWLRELTGPDWYAHDNGAVYPVGGAFVDYLLRRYGAGKFVRLYFAVRPGTFEAECSRVLGDDLDTIERDFWDDQQRVAGH